MKKFLVLSLLINFAIITYAWGAIALLGAISLFFAVFSVVRSQIGIKKAIPEKSAFAVIHTVGIFAIDNIFGIPAITAAALIVEMSFVGIFTAIYESS